MLPLSVKAQDYLGEGIGRPFNLTGSVSYGYAFTRTGDTESELNNINVKLSGNSPIWQPWFATMSAGVSLGLSTSDNTTGSESDATSSNIDLAFALFPISRFPFRLNYSRSVNEIDAVNFAGDLVGTSFGSKTTSQRLGLQQQYVSRNNVNYIFWYNNSKVDSDLSGETSTDALGFKIDHTRPRHRFDVTGNVNRNEQKDPSFETQNFTISGSHGYYPSQSFGVNSLISFANSESDTSSDVLSIESNISQVSSSFSWRPEHKPYTVSGGVRFSKTENENLATSGTENRNVNTSVTGSYRFSRHARGTFAANVGLTEAGGQQTLAASETVSLGYSSDSFVIGGYFYNWSSGVGASNSSTKLEGVTETGEDFKSDSQSANVSLGHAVGKNWVSETANFSLNISQSVSANKIFGDLDDPTVSDPTAPTPDPTAPLPDPTLSDPDEVNKSLSQSLSMSGNHYGWGGSTVFNTSISDTRTFSQDEVEFQVLTAQLARQQGINRLSSASGAIYFQASRTVDPSNIAITTGEEDEVQKSASMNVSFQHNRIFGVYGLRYKTTVEQTSIFDSGETKKGNLEWDNEFNYRIGLLSARLAARLIRTPEGDETLNMFFQATRTF